MDTGGQLAAALFAGLRDAKPQTFAGADEGSAWRVEERRRKLKDGRTAVYWNLRAREGFSNSDGKRIVPYKKGGVYYVE